MNYIPTFADNESCSILKDEPDVLVMEPEDSWVDFKSLRSDVRCTWHGRKYF